MAHRLTEYELECADVVIRPGVGMLKWADFSKAEEVIAAGESAALEQIETIASILPGGRSWFNFGDWLRRRRQGACRGRVSE